MRENRTYGSEGGEGLHPFPTPIEFLQSARCRGRSRPQIEPLPFRAAQQMRNLPDDEFFATNQPGGTA